MKLSEIKTLLPQVDVPVFALENGDRVPAHYHITEIGLVEKKFIDCGGTVRSEQKISFQLWHANDLEHRLRSQKLLNIIALSERKLSLPDAEIEVEYQGETIGIYGLDFSEGVFVLKAKATACLAEDSCGIPQEKLVATAESMCCSTGKC